MDGSGFIAINEESSRLPHFWTANLSKKNTIQQSFRISEHLHDRVYFQVNFRPTELYRPIVYLQR